MNRISRRSAAEAAESLLEVGRTEPVLDYDVELGLARHHDWVRSEVPMPEWASACVGTAATSLAPVVIKTLVSALLVGALAVGVWYARDRQQPSAAGVERPSPGAERVRAAAPSDRRAASEAWVATTTVPELGSAKDPSAAAAERLRPISTRTAAADTKTDLERRAVHAATPDKRPTRLQRPQREQRSARAASERVAPGAPNAETEARRSAGDSQLSGAVERASVPVDATRGRVEPATLASAAPSEDARVQPATRGEVASVPEQKRLGARPGPAPRTQAPDDLIEMQQLAAAEQLLERSPARALRLVRQGDQRFAHGYFQQERAYIAIMALIQLERVDEARALAASFAKQFPALPYGARIRSALEARKATSPRAASRAAAR